MTMAPAAANLGASSVEAAAPPENRARSRPARSAVAASSTTTSSPRKGIRRPADRAEANSLQVVEGERPLIEDGPHDRSRPDRLLRPPPTRMGPSLRSGALRSTVSPAAPALARAG